MDNRGVQFLMCPPDYFQISKPKDDKTFANAFIEHGYYEFQKSPKEFKKQAEIKWNALRLAFERELGVKIALLAPQDGLDDQVFTADASLSLIHPDQKATAGLSIISYFTNEERQAEIESHIESLSQLFPHRQLLPSAFRTEGTGDNVYDAFRDLYWSGYTRYPDRANALKGRSDIRSHLVLKNETGVDVVSLDVMAPFFHIDTALAPLPKGHIVCYSKGMGRDAFAKLRKRAFEDFGMKESEFLIEVSPEDAESYACNLVCVGDHIVMPKTSDALKKRLEKLGYEVIQLDLHEFILAGGGPHCLSNTINQPRILGGYAATLGFEKIISA